MARVVLDIETIGVDFEKLDEKSQQYLLKFAETDEEKEEARERLNLYPLTGEIVAISLLNPDSNRRLVFYQNGGGEKENFEEDGAIYESGTEMEILEKFWENIRSYNQIITFNGRGFDAPYLHLRSAILKITPTKNLMPYRYDWKFHCDLLDQLTYYGATRKFSLDFYAKTFGIKSPKEGGIDGKLVPEFYKQGKYKEIARYCLKDVIATRELFEYWDKYLRF
jgi:predicted PolB exonuclease-like 3'-5' exonuclease